MKRFSVAVSLFLVATMAGVIMANSPGFVVKAEVPNGIISIAFDDEYQNQFTFALPLMQKYGMVGTFYICTSNIGRSGYMTGAQLQTLQNGGNEIGSHSHTHGNFTSMSEAQIRFECSYSKQILEQSYGLAVTNFAYPNGQTTDVVDSIVSEYYRTGRTAYVEPYLMEVSMGGFRVAGFNAETADSTSLSLLEGIVDDVQSTNSWAIVFFHNIIPGAYEQQYTTGAEDFESFLNYTVSKGVQTLTVNQVLDSTSLFTTTNYGTVSPTSGWYGLGKTLTIEAFSPSSGNGERYVWLGWTGSGAGSYSGSGNPASITLNGPIQQTAMWRHEFKLSLSVENGDTEPSAGEYWYEAGSTVNVEALSSSETSGERFTWSGWTGTGAGSYSGSDMHAQIVMNSPITQSASWIHQYFVNISSVFGVVAGTGWYNSGTTVYATLNDQVVSETSDVRNLFVGWDGDADGSGLNSDPITVNGPKYAVALWKKQYLVVFNQTGLPTSPNPSIIVNSTSHDLPFSIWVDEGDRVEFAYPDNSQGFVLTFPLNQSSFLVTSPVQMTAQYATRDNTGLLTLVLAPLVLIFVLAAWLLVRRRKASS